MKLKIFCGVVLCLFLMGCSFSKEITKETIKFDKEYHENLLKAADARMKYVSCDIGLIDGLGIASSAKFPIMTSEDARAILANPAISLALGDMMAIAKNNNAWKQEDYDKCYLVGAGYRVVALSVIDVLKIFPQLAPYLAVFAQ